MMIFKTELNIPHSGIKLDHSHTMMTIGSCFSNHIGHRLQNYKFNCFSNPFGIVFNPISVSNLINRALVLDYVGEGELRLSQGIWVHPDFHSSLGSADKATSVQNVNDAIAEAHNGLKSIKFLFITFGSAIAYRLSRDNKIVSNCHKLPASLFEKTNISVNEGYETLKLSFDALQKFNPDIHIVLTISPVRHIKDGIIENSFSKARLHTMVDHLISNQENILYFPVYEWVMDDLRDYRYYEKDMIHPDDVAVDYIWQKFCEHFFATETNAVCKKMDAVINAAEHRPFYPDSVEHLHFKSNHLAMIDSILKEYPNLDFAEQRRIFS